MPQHPSSPRRAEILSRLKQVSSSCSLFMYYSKGQKSQNRIKHVSCVERMSRAHPFNSSIWSTRFDLLRTVAHISEANFTPALTRDCGQVLRSPSECTLVNYKSTSSFHSRFKLRRPALPSLAARRLSTIKQDKFETTNMTQA